MEVSMLKIGKGKILKTVSSKKTVEARTTHVVGKTPKTKVKRIVVGFYEINGRKLCKGRGGVPVYLEGDTSKCEVNVPYVAEVLMQLGTKENRAYFAKLKEKLKMKDNTSSDGKRYYIAYGSNLHIGQMSRRCPTAVVYGKSELKDYKLSFKRHGGGGCYLTVEPSEGDTVPVVIWEIQATDEAFLDRYEGYPVLYYKEMMDVNVDGNIVSAMIYIMSQESDYYLPHQSYVDTVCAGYNSFNFDVKFIQEALDRSRIYYNRERAEASL